MTAALVPLGTTPAAQLNHLRAPALSEIPPLPRSLPAAAPADATALAAPLPSPIQAAEAPPSASEPGGPSPSAAAPAPHAQDRTAAGEDAGAPRLDALFDGSRPSASLLDPVLGGSTAEDGAQFVNELHGTVQELWRRFFPGLFADLKVKPLFALSDEDNASYQRLPGQTPAIMLESSQPLSRGNTRAQVPAAFDAESTARGTIPIGLLSAVLYFHEYAHAVFDWKVTAYTGLFGGHSGAYHTLNEGFAVSMELALIDKLVRSRADLNLTEEDVSSLKALKRARIESLKRDRDAYTAGTFYFWHALSKRHGEDGVLRFLEHIDIERLSALLDKDASFRLLHNAPELFVPYLTGEAGDVPWARALDKLTRKKVPTRHEVEDLLLRVRPRAAARFIHQSLTGDPVQLATEWPAILDLAGRSPRFESLLSARLAKMIDSPAALDVVARRSRMRLGRLKRTKLDSLDARRRQIFLDAIRSVRRELHLGRSDARSVPVQAP